MRNKIQKIGRQERVTGSAHQRHSQGAGPFHEYRVTADSCKYFRVFACSANEAEIIARRLLGEERPYEGKMEVRQEQWL